MKRSAAIMATAAWCAAGSFALAHGSFRAGAPAPEKAATLTIDVDMLDADGKMSFRPDHVEISRGTTVKFVVHNRGALTHEFMLGDAAENAAHAEMMRQMPDMRHEDPNARTIDAGASSALAWRFTRKGQFEFACFLPGHYEAGMHGVVVVK